MNIDIRNLKLMQKVGFKGQVLLVGKLDMDFDDESVPYVELYDENYKYVDSVYDNSKEWDLITLIDN